MATRAGIFADFSANSGERSGVITRLAGVLCPTWWQSRVCRSAIRRNMARLWRDSLPFGLHSHGKAAKGALGQARGQWSWGPIRRDRATTIRRHLAAGGAASDGRGSGHRMGPLRAPIGVRVSRRWAGALLQGRGLGPCRALAELCHGAQSKRGALGRPFRCLTVPMGISRSSTLHTRRGAECARRFPALPSSGRCSLRSGPW